MRKLKAGTFPQELYALMCRYRDGAQIKDHKAIRKVQIKNHWATPPEVYEALRQLTDITKERFASPLNYKKNKPILTSGSKTGSQTDSSDGLAATVLPS